MKESTLLAMKNRLNDLTQESQFYGHKIQELELVLSSVIKLVEKLPGYEDARDELQKENEAIIEENKTKLEE